MESAMIASAQCQVAEVELVYKSKVKASQRPQIRTSRDCYEVLLQSWDENKIELLEQFKIMLLNRSNRVLAIYELSTGGITGTVADPRLIFTAALKANAVSIVLAHNHPSGDLKPSRQDEELTTKIKYAGDFLEIKVLDHLIICSESYFSFADEGLL
jgi:DNA repair protein RadC